MTPQQCRAARALIGLSRPQLGLVARVGKNTIQAFESGTHRASRSTVAKLRAAFASLSVRFVEDGQGIGVHRNFTLSEIETSDDFVDRPPTTPPRTSADAEIGAMTPAQSRAARAFLDISQVEAAARADVGLSLLVAFETEVRMPRRGNTEKIRRMFEAHGIVFTEINGVPAVQALPPPLEEPASAKATLTR